MNIDHWPKTDFEKNAVKSLASGKEEFEATENEFCRHAGVIRLASQCLKCHIPNRTVTANSKGVRHIGSVSKRQPANRER